MKRRDGLPLLEPRLAHAVLLALALMLVGACRKDEPSGPLDPSDFSVASGEGKAPRAFKKNDIIPSAELTDYDTIDANAIQGFFKMTPYKRKSFLVTYQSNGVRATDAFVASARKYRINPLLLLAYAQASQGLVSAERYPFPPERVEYVFGCGVLDSLRFEPSLAGLDQQLECLARALRAAIDQIQLNNVTEAGWGPGRAKYTLDEVKVTPASVATAALYDYTPLINYETTGGTWIVWNIFYRYAESIGYSGPRESGDGKWLGEECQSVGQCSRLIGDGVLCASAPQYPGGSCVVPCDTDKPCPTAPNKRAAYCAKFSSGAYCLPVCNPDAPDCRAGYECTPIAGLTTGDSKNVCLPIKN